MDKINKIFKNLNDWRHLPAYQLERRADIFFSVYLPEILYEKFGFEIDEIIPEFPVRIGTINKEMRSKNESIKMDYLAKAKDMNMVFFVELKTDVRSRNKKQDKALLRAKEVGIVDLLYGIKKIYEVTHSKKKYRYLLKKLQGMGWIKLGPTGRIDIVSNLNYKAQIVYIQPNENDRVDTVITFHEVADVIGKYDDLISKLFAKSIREWADVNSGDLVYESS